jgi:hypothetical protein
MRRRDESHPEPTKPSRWKVLRDRIGSSDRRVRGTAASTTMSLADAVSGLYERSIDRMLAASGRVTSAAEGQALLASEEGTEAVADRLQRVVVFAVPIVRTLAKGARFTRMPWVLLGTTAVSTGLTVRTGAREVQVLGSLVAHRIEETTGQPADPALVKKLTAELYLAPKRVPELSDRRLRLHRLFKRWLFRGAIGRKTGKAATKALEAAERLDIGPLITRWAELGTPSSPPPHTPLDRARRGSANRRRGG